MISVDPASNFSPIAVLVGAFMFGVGIVFAGGCATGTWYRAGEGLIGSWIALGIYSLFSTMMRTGPLGSFNKTVKGIQIEQKTIYQSLGISPWVLVGLLAIITLFFVFKQLRKAKKIASLKPKKTGIAHILFEKRWHPFVSAVLIGLIAILAWPLSIATGRDFGLGITSPTANLLQFLVTGELKFINWSVFLVLGILLGAFIAAKGSNEFRFRTPDSKTILSSAFGGMLMGIGASLAGGCGVGNGLVETAFFSWKGWVALLLMIFGTWSAAYITIIRTQKV